MKWRQGFNLRLNFFKCVTKMSDNAKNPDFNPFNVRIMMKYLIQLDDGE